MLICTFTYQMWKWVKSKIKNAGTLAFARIKL
jgi:hypothetical protein